MASTKFNIPTPDGYKKVFAIQDLAGAGYRKKEISKAFSGKKVDLEFELEPESKQDRNAIKVVAYKPGFFGGEKKYHILNQG